MNINTAIDQLILFAENNLMLDELDANYARNRVLAVLGLDDYRPSKIDEAEVEDLESCEKILKGLLDAAITGKLITAENREKTAQRIMRAISLNPGDITDLYLDIKERNPDKAEKWLDDYLAASMIGKKIEGDAFVMSRTLDGVEFVPVETTVDEKLTAVYAAVNNLIEYASACLVLDDLDKNYVTQDVLDILSLRSYAVTEIDPVITEADRPDGVIAALAGALLDSGITPDDDIDIVIDMLLGAVSIHPSKVDATFAALCKNSKKATDWLYEYGVKNNYIKRTLLDSNVRFKAGYTKGGLEITINKAKPEFADAKKAASGNATKSGYPKCSICAENEGYAPRERCTLRTVTLELEGEEWFWQFSPYGYFYKHGIAVNSQHIPMVVNSNTVIKLLDFVDRFPNMFLGCNAAMSGVGGSVLAHDHFQGGEETLPMHKAKPAIELIYPEYPLAEISVLDWYNSVVRVTSQSRQVIKDVCEEIISGWEKYTDKSKDIIAKDADGQHNGVSPTVRKLDNGRYCVDITLRNNRCTPEYPQGIFHAHPEFHAIKRESIGLIESQGLFILPGRLDAQIAQLNACLVEKTKLPADMADFKYIYDEIIKENGKDYTKVEAHIAIKAELGSVCERILDNTAVFKTNEETAQFLVSLGSFKLK